MKTRFTVFILLISLSVKGQDGLSVYLKIMDHYSKMSYMSVDYEMNQFQGKSNKHLGDVVLGSFLRSGDISYSKVGNVEILNAQPYAIQVNHDEREIAFSPFIAQMNFMNLPQLKDDLKKYKFSIKPSKGEFKILTVTVNENNIKTIDFYYSPISYDLNKLDINMFQMSDLGREVMVDYRIEIRYFNQFVSKKGKSNPLLVTENYIRKKGKNFIPAPRFKSYSLLDLDKTRVR